MQGSTHGESTAREGRPATGRSDLHRRLRAATAEHHDRLERALDLLSPELSLERYRRVLLALHGFYAPLEARLRSFEPLTPRLAVALPRRAPLLEADLAVLGAWPAGAECRDLPSLRSTRDVAGSLYVLEGAALGGQVLARALRERWPACAGTAFFHGDGPSTQRRWRTVLHWLAAVGATDAHADELVAAAIATFTALERWTRRAGAHA